MNKQEYIDYFKEKFTVEEVAPRVIVENYEPDQIWGMFEQDLLAGAGWFRMLYGPCICNDWANGGNFEWSGIRLPEGEYWSPRSQHALIFEGSSDALITERNSDLFGIYKKCSALDLKPLNYTAKAVREDIKALHSPFIRRMEDEVSWCHIDTKEPPSWHTGGDKIYFFKP